MLVEMNFNFVNDILYQGMSKPKKIIDYLLILIYWILAILLSTISAIFLSTIQINFLLKIICIVYVCFNFMFIGFCFNKSKTIFFPLFYFFTGLLGVPYYIYKNYNKKR